MISHAQHEVDLEMYEFQSPKVGHADTPVGPGSDKQQLLLDDLVEAKARGCDVNVVLDGSTSSFTGKQNNAEIAQYLQSKGVNVQFYPPHAAKIDHVKLLVTDNDKALIGGMNWGTHSPENHDADVLVEGPEAAKARTQIFAPDLAFAEGKEAQAPAPPPDDGGKCDFLTTAPREQGGGAAQIKDKILSDIDGAKSRVHAELFVLTDHDIIDSLKQARERGCDVKVLLDPNQARVNQRSMDALQQAGVDAKWYDVDASKRQLLHAKWATVDNDKTMVGSANWSFSGLAGGQVRSRFPGNHEADVNVRDEAVNGAFERQFEEDWAHHSTAELRELHTRPTQV
jgi:phosphatidylserine/phosphatidylglycerophosphate/cardiolipin synthase-like enzyme